MEALTNFATVLQTQLLKYSFTETIIMATAKKPIYEMFMNVSYYGIEGVTDCIMPLNYRLEQFYKKAGCVVKCLCNIFALVLKISHSGVTGYGKLKMW